MGWQPIWLAGCHPLRSSCAAALAPPAHTAAVRRRSSSRLGLFLCADQLPEETSGLWSHSDRIGWPSTHRCTASSASDNTCGAAGQTMWWQCGSHKGHKLFAMLSCHSEIAPALLAADKERARQPSGPHCAHARRRHNATHPLVDFIDAPCCVNVHPAVVTHLVEHPANLASMPAGVHGSSTDARACLHVYAAPARTTRECERPGAEAAAEAAYLCLEGLILIALLAKAAACACRLW